MQQKNRSFMLVLLVVVLAALLGGAVLGYQALTKDPNAMAQLQNDKKDSAGSASNTGSQSEEDAPIPLPAFSVLDSSGNTRSITDFQGKPTVINFWATWCGYCVEEMPDFQTAYETYGDRINFVMLNVTDGERETKKAADAYIEKHQFTFPVYYDTTMEAVYACDVTGYPTSLFVDADGNVTAYAPGKISGALLNSTLEDMLA